MGTLSANPSPERDLQNQGKDLTTRGTLQPQGKTSEVLWVLRNTVPANIKSQLVYLLVSVQPLKTLFPVMAHHPEVWAPGPTRLETGTNAVPGCSFANTRNLLSSSPRRVLYRVHREASLVPHKGTHREDPDQRP